MYSVSVPVSEKIRFALMIPPFELKTEEARAALPKTYSREDAVYNLSRSGLMTASLFSGNLQNLRWPCRTASTSPTAPASSATTMTCSA